MQLRQVVQPIAVQNRPVSGSCLYAPFLFRLIARVLQMYIGFSKFSFGEPGFLREICRWALKRVNKRGLTTSAIQRRDGQEIRSWMDLADLGFEVCILRYTAICCSSNAVVMQVQVLHTSSFAFNCRVLETRLHREFHSSPSRLWMKKGTGSYYMSEAALQEQLDNARISCAFIVHAPSSVCNDLFFSGNLPLHVHHPGGELCDDDDDDDDEDDVLLPADVHA
jgi:hypothetical protein